MKSRKITNQLKWSIRQRAINLKFKDEKEKLLKIEYTLAHDVYMYAYEDWLPIMTQLPTNAFNKKNYISVYYIKDNKKTIIDLQYSKAYAVFSRYEPVITNDTVKGIALIKRLKDIQLQQELLKHTIQTFESKLIDLLNQITTTKKLLELMPEAEAWLIESSCSDIPAADAVAELRKL